MNIEKDLYELQDIGYQKLQEKSCPGITNIIGIRIPILRAYAKKINGKIDINTIPNDYYEEIMLKGMLIGLEKELDYKKVEEFIPLIDNWAVCDTFCAGLKKLNKDKEKMWNFLLKYINSQKEFETRFSVVMILDYFVTDEYIDEVLKTLQKIKNDAYYTKMGVAWAYAECFIKYFDKTKIVFENMKEKDKFTYNKAIQKSIESYRLTQEQKDILRKMKI